MLRLPLLLLALVSQALAGILFHLKSGEEVEGTAVSLSGKYLEIVPDSGGRRRIPYADLAAIRMGDRLETRVTGYAELRKLFPDLALPEGSPARMVAPQASWAFQAPRSGKEKPEGHYLTFQALETLFYLRPNLAVNYEWTGGWPVALTGTLRYLQWPDGGADPFYQGDVFGFGGKAGARRYVRDKRRWYVAHDPEDLEDMPLFGESLAFQGRLAESMIRNVYPFMQLEVNLALGFRL